VSDKNKIMPDKIRAVQYGCGPIGLNVAALALRRNGIELAGAVDIDPDLAGRDLGEAAGMDRAAGVIITNDADELLSRCRPDIVFHTTTSRLETAAAQISDLVRAGANVVSTCEELSFPYRRDPAVASKLDLLARQNSATVLGTGINPGFLMDAWPLFMTGPCQNVTHVKVERMQDASGRRLPFQQKIGAGRTPEEFQALVESGKLRHVGLPESIAMLAAGLGWKLDEITESIEPVMAEKEVESPYLKVIPGQAAGVRQVGRGISQGAELILMEFSAFIGAAESFDSVTIKGTPDISVRIHGGTHGDISTAAMVVNAASRVVAAAPGLITMKDLPPVTAGS